MSLPPPPKPKPTTPIIDIPLPPSRAATNLVDSESVLEAEKNDDRSQYDDMIAAIKIPQPHPHFGKPKGLLEEEISIKTHETIYDQVIRSTLKPEHATDPFILRFISNYSVCKDVKQAARDAGLTAIDGRRLISYPDIYECVQRIATMNARKYGYDAEEVVAKVKEIIEFDPIDLFDPDTNSFYEDLNQIPPETRRVIKKLNVMNIYEKDPNGMVTGVKGKILKFEFWDKLKAAEMLGQEKEVFKKQVKVEHDVGKNMKDTLLGRIKDAEERKLLAAKDVTGE